MWLFLRRGLYLKGRLANAIPGALASMRLCRRIRTTVFDGLHRIVFGEADPPSPLISNKILTDARIRHAPDCAITCARGTYSIVPLSSPITLSDDEKLDALRRLDQFRQWRSLDEKRYCLVCGKIITGRQIQIDGGTRGNGALRLRCPTESCNSIPMDWVLPTDEIIAKVEIMAAEERKDSLLHRAAQLTAATPPVAKQEHHSIASRLRDFASHLKRHP